METSHAKTAQIITFVPNHLIGAAFLQQWIKDNSYTKNWWTLTHITPYPTTSYTLMVNPIVGHDLMSDMSYWMMVIQQKIEVYPAFYPDIKKIEICSLTV